MTTASQKTSSMAGFESAFVPIESFSSPDMGEWK